MSTPAVGPAERYAKFRERQANPEFASFRELYDFDFDPFQVAACGALTDGDGVLVAAPTGSGKTVVGEYAVHLALHPGPQVLLHHADQGAVQPEVQRPGQALRHRHGRPAHRRQRDQRRRPRRGDDHRGAAQHAVRGLARAQGPRLRRPRRGALPGRPLAGRGLGRGDHPPARSRSASSRCPPRSATRRSSATGSPRCAAAPRSSSTSTARSRCGSTCSRAAGCTTCSPTTTTARSTPTWSGWRTARRSASRPARPGRGGHRPRRTQPPYRPEIIDRLDGGRRCCPRSRSSSAGRAATPPCSSAWPRACG